MSYKEILERNAIELAGFEGSYMATPAAPFFLEEKFIRDTAKIAEFPCDITEEAVALAKEIMEHMEIIADDWELQEE